MKKAIRRRRYDLSTQSTVGALRRAVASLLGLFVLTFNVVGAGAVPVSDSGANPLFAQALLDDRIVICTAAGMVVMDKDGNIVAGDSTSGHADFCVFCLPLMHGGAKAPAAAAEIVLSAPAAFAGEIPSVPAPTAKPARLDGTASPRAPPLV